jgi:hypothetical protein
VIRQTSENGLKVAMGRKGGWKDKEFLLIFRILFPEKNNPEIAR